VRDVDWDGDDHQVKQICSSRAGRRRQLANVSVACHACGRNRVRDLGASGGCCQIGADCISYSTVTKYLKEKGFLKSMLNADFEPKNEEENFIDEAILGAL
jgi:hypothetical protein